MAYSHRILGTLLLIAMLTGGYSIARAAATVTRQNPSGYSASQWQGLFTAIAELPLAQRVALWADLTTVDAAYVADPLGEGPKQQPDIDPLCDFAHVDCVTFVEQVYALALSKDFAGFPDTLQSIRYCDGQIDFRWRNHYLVSDWLPANAWFIADITDDIGGKNLTPMTKTIARGKFFADKKLLKYANLPDEEATTNYIPREKVTDVLDKLQTADLIIFVIDAPGIIAGHAGLIRVDGNVVSVQHASLTAKSVITVPLADYLKTAPTRFLGFKIARPQEPTPPTQTDPVKPNQGTTSTP